MGSPQVLRMGMMVSKNQLKEYASTVNVGDEITALFEREGDTGTKTSIQMVPEKAVVTAKYPYVCEVRAIKKNSRGGFDITTNKWIDIYVNNIQVERPVYDDEEEIVGEI